jgi:hypothetical protein
MKKLASLVAVLALVGCASAPPAPKDATDFPTLIKEAKAAQKKAKSVGSEWRDTGKFIKKAEAAFKKGDEATAMKLATKAKREGEMGYAQGMDQKKAGPWLF